MKNPRVVSILRDLLQDDEVVGHAVIALGKIGSPAVLPDIEALIGHPKEWVRQEAGKTLVKIKARLV